MQFSARPASAFASCRSAIRRERRSSLANSEAPGSGPDPERHSYASFATFRDPDGHVWLLQAITARLPGRVGTHLTTFTSATELAGALRRAAAAHGEHEKRSGTADTAGWPDWYADYMVREQAGKPV